MSDEELQQLPDLNLAQARFILTLKDHPGAGEAKTKLLDAVTAESSFDSVTNELIHLDMYPLYLELCEQFAWPVDKDFVEKMQQANKDKIQALDAKIEDAEKNLGETEVIRRHKPDFFSSSLGALSCGVGARSFAREGGILLFDWRQGKFNCKLAKPKRL